MLRVVRNVGEEMKAFRLRQLGLNPNELYDYWGSLGTAVIMLEEDDSEWADCEQEWGNAVHEGDMTEFEYKRRMKELEARHDDLLEGYREEVWAELGWSE